MPRFPGCEEITDLSKKNACAADKMLRNIYTNITYPEQARKNNTEGIVVVQFVINKKGEIISPKIIRGLGDGLDEEVIRVVREMPEWIPGKQNGKKVSVSYNLPVKFKIEGNAPVEKEDTEAKIHVIGHKASKTEDKEIFSEVDQMPFFPGCADIDDLEERKTCATQKLLMYIYKNITYPELARKTGTQGTLVVRFVVDKTGKVTKPKMVKSLGQGCDVEVLRIIETMPNWEPGIHQGKPVNVYFNLPVKFKLEGDPPKVDESAKPISLTIFPNPADKDLTVKINAAAEPVTLYLSDITGKILKEVSYENFSGTGEEGFDLTKLDVKGTLLITAVQGTITKTEQVILK
jgi:TonB family protein